MPANNCIMRIQSGVCQLFRESLYSQGFMEIHSPKLIGGRQAGRQLGHEAPSLAPPPPTCHH